jgi:two-component system, OmpR family, alkaline phosphatase synthesis response regulator PhoP
MKRTGVVMVRDNLSAPEFRIKKSKSSAGQICIDIPQHRVWVGNNEVNLTLREFDLLLFLTKNAGIFISRDDIKKNLWLDHVIGDRIIDLHVCRLRKKIELEPHSPKRLVTIRGLGYILRG